MGQGKGHLGHRRLCNGRTSPRVLQGRWLRQPQRLETAVPWTIAEKDPSRLAAPGLGRSMWLSHDVPSSWMASVAWPLETSLRRPIKRSCNFDVAFH